MSVPAIVLRVYGIVQGVGFRPFVSRLAATYRISGSVCNKGPYVEIIARGAAPDLTAFKAALVERAPERSTILKVDEEPYTGVIADGHFDIITSAKERGDIFVSPDIAICPKCKEELFDKNNRRYLHPFINCTACGPRLTILESMPYDRERTSMGEFPMCDQCHYEYTHAETRRYDAQPVCCNDCGPEVYILGTSLRREKAITETRRVISSGGIAAIKGIGGFHLCCDATNEMAVKRLRVLKRRPVKPFAVMMKDLSIVKRECLVGPGEMKILDGPQKPIILLEKKPGVVAGAVAPGNPKLGVMLPYAPLQLLLFTYADTVRMPEVLVMTSANESGAPICRTDEDAVAELSGLCDVILSHDRKIRLRADDSVMDFYEDKPYMIRRSRGYAPLPVMVDTAWQGEVLAIGGELKNSFCLARGNLFYLSPYIGDLTDIRTVKALQESLGHMEKLLETKPCVVACDLHPRYNSSLVAKELGLPVITVQHHYAHVVSCMAENNVKEPVIGVSFDGTGYGPDDTIWGGEFLLADYQGYVRAGSVEPFMQRGGDISAKEGWRIAFSILYELFADKDKTAAAASQLELCDEANTKAQFFLADNNLNSIKSTSAGRLFDAVSALLGICRVSTFEGEAAMGLEYAAENWLRKHGDKVSITLPEQLLSGPTFTLPTSTLFRLLAEARLAGCDSGELAYAFHKLLTELIVAGCCYIRTNKGIERVALTGGVFQNRLLLTLCDRELQETGFTVLKHSLFPANDGGIALGQAVIAMSRLNCQTERSQ